MITSNSKWKATKEEEERRRKKINVEKDINDQCRPKWLSRMPYKLQWIHPDKMHFVCMLRKLRCSNFGFFSSRQKRRRREWDIIECYRWLTTTLKSFHPVSSFIEPCVLFLLFNAQRSWSGLTSSCLHRKKHNQEHVIFFISSIVSYVKYIRLLRLASSFPFAFSSYFVCIHITVTIVFVCLLNLRINTDRINITCLQT